MVDEQRPHRFEGWVERARALGRSFARAAMVLLRDPVRLLIGAIAIVLLVVSIPLLVGGGQRLERAWSDFRHHRSVDQHWIRATGTVTEVRYEDGLGLALVYRDRHGDRHRTEAHLETPGDDWIGTRVALRYDPLEPSAVDLIGVPEPSPIGSALVAGAAIGSGLAALILAIAVWRRRKLIAVSAHPLHAVRLPLATAGVLLVAGLTAWAIGTVTLQGWTGVADRIGRMFATAFGDFLGVLVPAFAFVAGCLLTAWLARHRHHEEHEGVLSSAHRIIDRAAGYVPSPEELKAADDPSEPPDELPSGPPSDPPASDRSEHIAR
jgi:hypothetical protein